MDLPFGSQPVPFRSGDYTPAVTMRRPAWRRKWAADALADGWSPVPSQIVSNEEYVPLPPTREQRRVAHRLREMSSVLRLRSIGRRLNPDLGDSPVMADLYLE